MDPGTPLFPEKWKLGYLLDVILTRDTRMHRVAWRGRPVGNLPFRAPTTAGSWPTW